MEKSSFRNWAESLGPMTRLGWNQFTWRIIFNISFEDCLDSPAMALAVSTLTLSLCLKTLPIFIAYHHQRWKCPTPPAPTSVGKAGHVTSGSQSDALAGFCPWTEWPNFIFHHHTYHSIYELMCCISPTECKFPWGQSMLFTDLFLVLNIIPGS